MTSRRDDDDLARLARVLRAFRKETHETREQFATRAGLDRGFVGAVERGERNLGHRKTRELLVGLGITWVNFGRAMQEADPLPQFVSAERRARVQRSIAAVDALGPRLGFLGTVIRAFRKELQETQEQFVLRAGFDRGCQGAIERGERDPGHRKMRELLIGLGITWEDFGRAMQQADPLPAMTAAERRDRVQQFVAVLHRSQEHGLGLGPALEER